MLYFGSGLFNNIFIGCDSVPFVIDRKRGLGPEVIGVDVQVVSFFHNETFVVKKLLSHSENHL